jgi:Zn-dependent metalloprotease
MRAPLFLLLRLLVALASAMPTRAKSHFFKGELGFVALPDSNGTFSAQSDFQASALDTMKGFLAEGLGATGEEDIQVANSDDDIIVEENGNVHIRYHHYIDGLQVEGAALMMHIKRDGRVRAINGEYSPTLSTDFTEQTTIACDDAIKIALLEMGVENEEAWKTCEMAAVYRRDGLFQKAYKALVEYSDDEEPRSSFVFASPTTGNLVALHPQLFGASMIVKDCQNTLYNCRVVNSRTRSQAASDAVKNAKATLDFYNETFGRDSVDGKGATITLHVNYDDHVNNAYYGDNGVYYGSGDGE